MTESDNADRAPRAPALSGLVVCRNEASQLGECLASLRFCNELVVVDLGSQDGSRQVARAAGARVVVSEPVLIVEQIRARALTHATHDWVIFLDPDERVPPVMATALVRSIAANPDVGAIRVPRRYHLKGRPIQRGYWAGPRVDKTVAVHRHRARPVAQIHGGWHCAEGFRQVAIADAGEIVHHWADSYRRLLTKHLRYLPFEAAARVARGQRFDWSEMLIDLCATLRADVVEHEGLAAGRGSWPLVLFHLWYEGACWLALRRHQKHSRSQLANADEAAPSRSW